MSSLKQSSPVFFAHLRKQGYDVDEFTVVENVLRYLSLTGTFSSINGVAAYIEARGAAEIIPKVVPLQTDTDRECFLDYLCVTREIETEERVDSFLKALRNIDEVLKLIYTDKGWDPIQAFSWPDFTEAYEKKYPLFQDTSGRLYELFAW